MKKFIMALLALICLPTLQAHAGFFNAAKGAARMAADCIGSPAALATSGVILGSGLMYTGHKIDNSVEKLTNQVEKTSKELQPRLDNAIHLGAIGLAMVKPYAESEKLRNLAGIADQVKLPWYAQAWGTLEFLDSKIATAIRFASYGFTIYQMIHAMNKCLDGQSSSVQQPVQQRQIPRRVLTPEQLQKLQNQQK